MSNSDPSNGGETAPMIEAESGWRVVEGILITFALQLLQILVLWLFPGALGFIGVTQLIYIIPAVVIARRNGTPRLAMGLIIGAAMVFSLNATCNGLRF